MKLDGRTAIVTGGATGIGRAIVERLVAGGARVVIADLRGAEQAAREVGEACVGVEIDVSSQEDTRRMATVARERLGRIDILVNNAGIFTGVSYTPMEELRIEDWQRMMAVNVMGPWLCASACAPHMRENGGGRIINIASVISHVGIPFMLHYVASKGALQAMTRGMAREFAAVDAGISVNSISPGYTHSANAMENAEQHAQFEGVASQMRTIKRPQMPADIAGTAAWLASDDAAYVNGQNIIVDGGIFMGL